MAKTHIHFTEPNTKYRSIRALNFFLCQVAGVLLGGPNFVVTNRFALFYNSVLNMAGGRERAESERTLVCLLQAVQGHRTIVELRNESFAEGRVENVDGFMNISMSDVKFVKGESGEVIQFPSMFIHGRQIRYVQIPDIIDMRKAIEEQLSKIGRTRKVNPVGKRVKKKGENT